MGEHHPSDNMEVDGDGTEGPLPPRPILPPKEWLPAIRPAIQGRRILSDSEDEFVPPPPPKTRPRPTGAEVEEIVSKKLKEFSSQFREEMGRMFSKLMEKFSTTPLEGDSRRGP